MSEQPDYGSPEKRCPNTDPIPEEFLVHACKGLPEDQRARREAGMHQDGKQ